MPDLPDTYGLSEAEVAAARRRYGWNELPAQPGVSRWRVFARQFASFLVLILVVAAAIALAIGEWIDALTIGLVILLNAALGFVQEWRAETALVALRAMLSPNATVIRDGQEQVIPAREVVPGDVLVLSAGSRIAADADILDQSGLQVDESVLTGESVPVLKDDGADGTVFAGTSVTAGRAEAKVTAIGSATEFGKIARLTGDVGEKRTSLQIQLTRLARQLGAAALLAAAAVGLLGLAGGRALPDMVLMSLSLAVAIVPEGLPAVITITLALGATAMVRRNALARRLQAVETLGAASVICTDKTGTLTENKMTATQIWTLERSYSVTGTGYDPAGHIAVEGRRVRAADDPLLAEVLQTGLHCNHATLRRSDDDGWNLVGEPTEGALVTLALKGWVDQPERRDPLAELPFSSERKRMSVLHPVEGASRLLTKGAPERIVEICTSVRTGTGARRMTDEDRQAISSAYDAMAGSGLRVIALAARDAPDGRIDETDLTFLGLVGLIDPPRAEVRGAIASARSAGIRTILITGDSPVTAKAIADQLALPVDTQITGPELDAMDDEDLRRALEGDILFARTKPEQKMRIVATLQALGNIVAMTGDGVNDAPALKRADIGVSMGLRGTDVARDASDLVLLDDNFATIVSAIREGRRQFGNVRKFVRYMLSSNAGELIALAINIAVGGPLVFLATQILWMNLVTDGVTAVALGLEKAEPDQMEQPPRPRHSSILGVGGIVSILAFGTYTGLASLWIFYHLLELGTDVARTTAFTAMVVFEKLSVLAFRSFRLPGYRIGWFSNPLLYVALAAMFCVQIAAVYWPVLQAMLHTVPIGMREWGLIAIFALPIVLVPEGVKMLLSARRT